jgi:hypothetical protein
MIIVMDDGDHDHHDHHHDNHMNPFQTQQPLNQKSGHLPHSQSGTVYAKHVYVSHSNNTPHVVP